MTVTYEQALEIVKTDALVSVLLCVVPACVALVTAVGLGAMLYRNQDNFGFGFGAAIATFLFCFLVFGAAMNAHRYFTPHDEAVPLIRHS